MNKRNLLVAGGLSGLMAVLLIAGIFAISDVDGGDLTVVGLCLSPFWLILCGACGALLYRRLSGGLPVKSGLLVGGLGGLIGFLLPFLGLILTFFVTSDLQTALSGSAFFVYVAAFLIWIPLIWIVFGALGGLIAALFSPQKPAPPLTDGGNQKEPPGQSQAE